MLRTTSMLAIVSPLALFTCSTLAQTVIDFEDAIAALGRGSKLQGNAIEDFYQDRGLTIRFGKSSVGVPSAYLHAGVSIDDAPDYRIEGTNGPSSFVIAAGADVITLSFAEEFNVTLDIGASSAGVSEDNPFEDFTVSTFRNGVSLSVDSERINVTPFDPDGEWITRSYEAVSSIRIRRPSGFGQFAVLAIDNIRLEPVITDDSMDVADGTLGGFVVASPGVGNADRYIDGGAGGGVGERIIFPNGEDLEFGPHISTISAATVSGVRVRAVEGGLNPRAINQIRVLADTDNDGVFETEATVKPIQVPFADEPSNDAAGNELDVTLVFPPITAQNWQILMRNEFRNGAQIREVDLLGTLSPTPSIDLQRDGQIDVFDLIAFLQGFSAALN